MNLRSVPTELLKYTIVKWIQHRKHVLTSDTTGMRLEFLTVAEVFLLYACQKKCQTVIFFYKRTIQHFRRPLVRFTARQL